MIPDNLYKQTAKYYDYDPRNIVKEDLAFYEMMAEKFKGPILELACGTGRVLLHLVAKGYQMTGVDRSEAMLEVLNEKLAKRSLEQQKRANIVQGSMTDFTFHSPFPLIVIPFRSFQILEEEKDQRSCLQSVYSALDDHGRFILHIFRPKGVLDESWVYPERVQWEVFNSKTNERVIKTDKGVSIDVTKQRLVAEQVYKVTKDDGSYFELPQHISLTYYYEEQIRELLESEGFIIEEIRNGFDMNNPNEGHEMVVICKKKLSYID
ncbi:class I SAM-dependent methyltransferase [Bacillus shivajii]|uniref:class I SAM-dependent DNA methyltransferase n=1 Tax=Bacillus shivajii TaxID=1983719 RepID=UPI001CF9F238|nr:class I SAM-dependent methyltransferase [Bacillus shivajii]UCZ54166.1 class I SAM-dependent methyltransferase [Bacillus shivajii]